MTVFILLLVTCYLQLLANNLNRENEINSKVTDRACPCESRGMSALSCKDNIRGSNIKTERHIRIILAKPGLDGHDRGVKVMASAFRDAGMEVIYLGLRQTPEMIVEAALQEDADVIALSILSGAHMTIFPRVRKLMNDKGLSDVLLTGGGIIPAEDMNVLREQGVGELFGPGTPVSEPIEYIRKWVSENR